MAVLLTGTVNVNTGSSSYRRPRGFHPFPALVVRLLANFSCHLLTFFSTFFSFSPSSTGNSSKVSSIVAIVHTEGCGMLGMSSDISSGLMDLCFDVFDGAKIMIGFDEFFCCIR